MLDNFLRIFLHHRCSDFHSYRRKNDLQLFRMKSRHFGHYYPRALKNYRRLITTANELPHRLLRALTYAKRVTSFFLFLVVNLRAPRRFSRETFVKRKEIFRLETRTFWKIQRKIRERSSHGYLCN